MRRFRYNDLDGVKTVTEDEIIRDYFSYWQAQMIKVGKADQITREACIEDWVVIHWAWELPG